MNAVFIARHNGQTFTKTSKKREYRFVLLGRLTFEHALEMAAKEITEERLADLWAYHERHAARVPSEDLLPRGEYMVAMSAHLAAKELLEKHGSLAAYTKHLKAVEMDEARQRAAEGYYEKFHVIRWATSYEGALPKPSLSSRWSECVTVPVEKVEKVARRKLK